MTRRFKRPTGQRRYKWIFVVVAEGTVTEREYFLSLSDELVVDLQCLRNRVGLSPESALKRIRDHIAKVGLRKGDEAWVVFDRDCWSDAHLTQIHIWSQERPNYGFALSNPKFEYWLLLHFENAGNVKTAAHCDRRLSVHIPNYNKHINANHFTRERINAAIKRAKARDMPPCEDWPRNPGSTVYRLITRILSKEINRA